MMIGSVAMRVCANRSPCKGGNVARFCQKTFVALLLFGIAFGAVGQDDGPISAERPGFSSSPIAIAAATWQLEFGYQFSHDRSGADIDDHTLPLLLLRVGLADRVEFQFGWAGVSWTDVNGVSLRGANDASLGLKWQVTDKNASTLIGLFAGFTMPVGADEFSSNEVDPAVGLFWSHSAAGDLFGTLLISESNDDAVASNAIGASFSLDGGMGAYVEYVGTFGANGGPQHSVNGGMTFLANNNLQLDLHAGLGLNDRATDIFIGLGAAYRL